MTNLLQPDHAMQFLQGLNDGYFAIKSRHLLQKPFATVNKIYSLYCKKRGSDYSLYYHLLFKKGHHLLPIF